MNCQVNSPRLDHITLLPLNFKSLRCPFSFNGGLIQLISLKKSGYKEIDTINLREMSACSFINANKISFEMEKRLPLPPCYLEGVNIHI